jgi:hypothetical protein
MLQGANAAAARGKPWAADAVAALVRGGLGSLNLAHAECAAQLALPLETPQAAKPDLGKPYRARHMGADILALVTECLTPPISRALVRQGLVPALLQVCC